MSKRIDVELGALRQILKKPAKPSLFPVGSAQPLQQAICKVVDGMDPNHFLEDEVMKSLKMMNLQQIGNFLSALKKSSRCSDEVLRKVRVFLETRTPAVAAQLKFD